MLIGVGFLVEVEKPNQNIIQKITRYIYRYIDIYIPRYLIYFDVIVNAIRF